MNLSWTVLANFSIEDIKGFVGCLILFLTFGGWVAYKLSPFSHSSIQSRTRFVVLGPLCLLFLSLGPFSTFGTFGFNPGLFLGILIAVTLAFGLGLSARHQPSVISQIAGVFYTLFAGFALYTWLLQGLFHDGRLPPRNIPTWLYLIWPGLWLPFSIWLFRRGYRKATRKMTERTA